MDIPVKVSSAEHSGHRLTIEEETEIIGLIIAGYSYADIRKMSDRHPDENKIANVKKRNLATIERLKALAINKQVQNALAIKNKANTKLGQRLDADDKNEEIVSRITDDYINGDINIKEYHRLLNRHRTLSVQELVTVSKEMHAQSVKEDKPRDSPDDLKALADAIASGDEVSITKAVFNRKT